MTAMVCIFLFACGAACGSFAGVLAWRLHARKDFVKGRSECEHCHRVLSPLDLVPIIGWLLLKGKCRYCRTPVSAQYPLTELIVGSLFVVSYLCWPLGFVAWQAMVLFIAWLVYIIILAALLLYDLRWMLLPDALTYPLIAVSFIDAALRVSLQPGATVIDYISYVVLGAAGLAGIYGLIYVITKGRGVGFGDVKLGLFMGIVVGWPNALLILALANIFGVFIIIPRLLRGNLQLKSRIPFGPLLIIAFIVVGLFGSQIITRYIQWATT